MHASNVGFYVRLPSMSSFTSPPLSNPKLCLKPKS